MKNKKGFKYYLTNTLILVSCLLIIGYAVIKKFKSFKINFLKLKNADEITWKNIIIALIIYLVLTEIIYLIFKFKDKKQDFDFYTFSKAGTASVGIMLLGGFLYLAFSPLLF